MYIVKKIEFDRLMGHTAEHCRWETILGYVESKAQAILVIADLTEKETEPFVQEYDGQTYPQYVYQGVERLNPENYY